MKRKALMAIADEAYPDGEIGRRYNTKTDKVVKKSGDGLAQFITQELYETYNEDASDEDQLKEVVRVMESAKGEIDCVAQAFFDKLVEEKVN